MTQQAKTIQLELEDYFPVRGWVRRFQDFATEHEVFKRTRQLQKRKDVRFLRVLITEGGHLSRYTIKTRFPAVVVAPVRP